MSGNRKASDKRASYSSGNLFSLFACALHIRKDPIGATHEGLSHRRHTHAALVALEQRSAELVLKFMDTARQRRLRQPKGPGRRPEAAVLSNSADIAEL